MLFRSIPPGPQAQPARPGMEMVDVPGIPGGRAERWDVEGGYLGRALGGLTPEQKTNMAQLAQERDKLFAQAPQPAAQPGGGLFGAIPAWKEEAAKADAQAKVEYQRALTKGVTAKTEET